MSAVELLDAPMVVPDSIEVVESYRTWNLDNGRLVSHNGVVWKPGEPLHAECKGSQFGYEWALVRRGGSLADAQQRTNAHNQHQSQMHGFSSYGRSPASFYSPPYLTAPKVEPPDGYGYNLVPVTHEVPHENCSCGIYSGTTLDICPGGLVSGKVKLWGKVVPGEKGYRAEYAYPSEFIVPSELAEDPALLAFGVPITVNEKAAAAGTARLYSMSFSGTSYTSLFASRRRANWSLRIAVGLNVGVAALNLTLMFLRIH